MALKALVLSNHLKTRCRREANQTYLQNFSQ